MNELWHEALEEVIGRPFPFAAELVQFVILCLILRAIFLRTIGKTLSERKIRIAQEVEHAGGAEAAFARAQDDAQAKIAAAEVEAERIRREAITSAEQKRREGRARIATEAASMIEQAERAIELNKSQLAAEASDRLVDLVGHVVRRHLEESMSESERRALTQKLILASLEREGEVK